MPRKKPLPEFETAAPAPRVETSVEPVLTCVADVQPESVKWVWPSRIPCGKLTLISGDPGLGKSTLVLDVGARVTTGTAWPDGSGHAPIGEVLLLSAEDGVADTIRPRLDAAGADVRRIHVLESKRVTVDGKTRDHGVTLDDLPIVEAALDRHPDCKLVILDPVGALMGKADSHKESDVRGLLAPWAKMAETRGVAIVVVAHLNKSNSQKALYRVSGSLGFSAAARVAWIVASDRDDPDKRIMARTKGNLSADPGAIGFRLRSQDSGCAAVEWIEGVQNVTADQLLAPPDFKQGGGKIDEAKEYLRVELAAGPRLQTELEANAPCSARTLKTAKMHLKVKSSRPGGAGPWWWELPCNKDADLHAFAPLHPSPQAAPEAALQATSELEGKSAGVQTAADYTDDELGEMADRWSGEG